MEPTHASFFSGVGGLDLGLERAGWRTVSFSEIDPYASAVLTERWPGILNLGDITALADATESAKRGRHEGRVAGTPRGRTDPDVRPQDAGSRTADWQRATLWSGGFPCQDLSVAGKRRGLAGSRSGLAWAFLDLVERHRPPAVLLENVPGLLSSHGGRDLGALLGTLGQLGYGWAFRVLDAQHFGVPQRRRRVFILGIHARVDPSGQRAAEVLSVGTRCGRHPAMGHEAGPGVAARPEPGVDIARTVVGTAGKRHDEDIDTLVPFVASDRGRDLAVVGSSPDPDGVRAADGLAGRLDDRTVAATLNSGGYSGGFRTEPGEHLVYRKATKAHHADDWERWERADMTDTLDAQAMGAVQSTAVLGAAMSWAHDFVEGYIDGLDPRDVAEYMEDGNDPRDICAFCIRSRGNRIHRALVPAAAGDAPMLPLGLDSHRYRCCGNGVVSNVAEWIGRQLLSALESAA